MFTARFGSSRFTAARSGSSSRPAGSACASSYRDLEIESIVLDADPHRLIELLYDDAMARLTLARAALRDGQTATKGEATGRVLRILEEGLKASLDTRGGELAANLRTLYDYMSQRLLRANAANDDAGYAEVAGLLDGLRQAWKEIGPQVRDPARAMTAAPAAAPTTNGAAAAPGPHRLTASAMMVSA